jgi:hypothetical protein
MGPSGGWSAHRFLLGLATCLPIALSACGGDDSAPPGGSPALDGGSDSDAAPTVVAWHEADYPYRVAVHMLPHPKKDRTDAPLIAAISHAGASIQRDVRVHPVAGGSAPLSQAGAWSQPDGTVFEVGFKAEGTTKAGESRDFLVYYKTAAAPSPWGVNSQAAWSQSAAPDGNGDSKPDAIALSGGGYALARAFSSDGRLAQGRRDDGNTYLKLSAGDWTVAQGFSTDLQIESGSATYPTENLEQAAPTSLAFDGDAMSAAAAAVWQGVTTPVAHDAFLTYRLFANYPFAEAVVSATMGSEYKLSSADWSGRDLYLNDTYDRMVSDTRGDEALEKIWDTSMRWLVVYNAATNKSFGWFLFHPGVVRAETADGKPMIYDSYGYAAGGSSALRYLWMASTSKDDVVSLFDAMQPGVSLGDPERRELNILVPKTDDFYFPADTLGVLVSTPGNTQPVTATLALPDGKTVPVELARDANPLLWRAVAPRVFVSTDPPGAWTITAQSAGVDAQARFEFRLPSHPHLLFSSADLAGLKARKDQASYAPLWNAMLHKAEGYDAPIPDPGPGKDIRSYADRLVNLALIQLVDPAQPYDAMLWNYFFTMLRYPNWDSQDVPFNNLDLTVGHFLTALSLVYDWHYDHFTPAERQEIRARLRGVTEKWVSTGYLATYRNIDWQHFGTETNNHTWINHEGVAAVAFVLADEMPETVRAPWVSRIEENLGIILSVLEDDGASNEGVAYHSYGQINLFPWIDMRDRALGGSTVAKSPWFEQSVLWDLYSILPGGDDNYGGVANFGDCPPTHYQAPRTIQAWLASRLGDGHAQWSAQDLDWPDVTPMSYLWYDPSVTASTPDSLPPWRLFPRKGIFTSRSSWANDATYFSLKSGSYYGGHEQPDAGHFILHRAGVPYVTDHGYSYLKKSDEHNLVVFDDTDQWGGGKQWMESVDPQHWARVDSLFADSRFFDLVADPAPMVNIADLQSWKREVVGLPPDIFLVRDGISAGASHKLTWLLHSYKSKPPASEQSAYTFLDTRTENPWTEVSATQWLIQPQPSAPSLHVADLSATAWTASVESSLYVPEQNPDTKGYNEAQAEFQVGYRLNRSVTSDHATSLVALWFGDPLSVDSWSNGQAEAARFHNAGTDVLIVLWPNAGQVSGLQGLDAAAQMAGRRIDQPAIFGRAVTAFSQAGNTLVISNSPVDLFARLEHAWTAADPGYAIVRAAAATTLQVRCATQPSATRLDGATVTATWSNAVLTLSVPAGEHRIEVQ